MDAKDSQTKTLQLSNEFEAHIKRKSSNPLGRFLALGQDDNHPDLLDTMLKLSTGAQTLLVRMKNERDARTNLVWLHPESSESKQVLRSRYLAELKKHKVVCRLKKNESLVKYAMEALPPLARKSGMVFMFNPAYLRTFDMKLTRELWDLANP